MKTCDPVCNSYPMCDCPEKYKEILKASSGNSDLLNALEVIDSYCCHIFQNSESFLDRFFEGQNIMELIGVYFAPSEIKLYYVLHCGQHVTSTVSMVDYLDWLGSV